MDFNYLDRVLPNISKKDKKLDKSNIKGIVLHSNPKYFNKEEIEVYTTIKERNKDIENYGIHYSIDEVDNDIYTLVPIESQAISIEKDLKTTYISKNLFNEKPEEFLISVYICVNEEQDYEKTEKKLILFLACLLKEYNLTAQDVWRGFDLSKDCYEPFHLLNKDIFALLIAELEKFIPPSHHNGGIIEGIPVEELPEEEKEEIDFSKVKIVSPFKEVANKADLTINQYVYRIYKDNAKDYASYVSKFQPWNKERDDTKTSETLTGDLITRETPYENILQYKIKENPPLGLDHSEQAVDEIDAVETLQDVMVEPIYPDLITPPGEEIHIANGVSKTNVQSNSNTPLNAEEFEKRQKTFDFSQFSDLKKETKGRPINTEDPFPVDDQIKKLEEHYPKVKIDKTTFNFKDTNHPNSEIGNAMIKNLAMSYDMINEVAKRTEQRLVKLENNVATIMRNLFRLSSRVNINCVYYGGQSIYNKYKCIRCLDDNRIHDGALVSIDQCLNCTRFEPILGQVYAILDETGSNIVQVMDDIQMSYMELKQYKDLNSINGYYDEMINSKVDIIPAESPKPFTENKWKDNEEELEEKSKEAEEEKKKQEEKENNKDNKTEDKEENNDTVNKADVSTEKEEVEKAPNGFKMNWNPVILETQKPHINKYDIEGLKADKVVLKSETQEIDRKLFKDSREDATEYERLEFNVKDYAFDDFGIENKDIEGSSATGSFGMGALEVRQKIVDYALNAVKLCDEGKAWYWMDGTHRNCHDGKNCGMHTDGKQYWDCSSLVRDAYKNAGLGVIGELTYDLFDKCKNSAGGILIPLSDVSKAMIGDIVFFNDSVGKNLSSEQLQNVNKNGVRHVAIYTGNNMIAHASSSKWGIKHTELQWDKGAFAFGRPKALVELDNSASVGNSAAEWSREYHNIPDELWNAGAVGESNAKAFIDNIKKYGYRDALVKVAKAKNLDPYFVAAICSVESGGNPTLGGPHPGIMQCTGGYGTTTLSGIEENFNIGCDGILARNAHLKSCGWVEGKNMHIVASAHNSGQYGVTDAHGCSNTTTKNKYPKLDLATVKIPESSEALRRYTREVQKSWSPEVKRTYATKVLRAYNVLYSQNILNLPREQNTTTNNNSNSNISIEGMPTIQKKQIKYNISNRTSTIKYIAIHDTANPGGTAQNHFDYFNGGNRNASADYFVDKSNIIEISNPDVYYTWEVGDGNGKNGITNQNTVGIEMCLEYDSTIHPNTFNNTVMLTKHLMQRFNIPKSNVVRHFDASGKWCPERFRANNWAKWNEFKSKL